MLDVTIHNGNVYNALTAASWIALQYNKEQKEVDQESEAFLKSSEVSVEKE